MNIVVRQTYTAASLVAMVPAAIWAAVNYGAHTMVRIVGAFPFFYLFVCQLLVVPRYALCAWIATRLGRRRWFDVTGAVVGFVSAGLLVDAWITTQFAYAVSRSPAENWPFLVPILGFAYGLPLMYVGMLIGGNAGTLWRRPAVQKRIKRLARRS